MADKMSKVTIDGVAYEAEAPVVASMHQMATKLDGFDSIIAQHEARADEAESRADRLEAELDQLKLDKAELEKKLADQPADFQARVDARVALIAKAKDLGVEIKADMSDRQIMVACVAKTDSAFTGEGKSDDYVTARFDAALAAPKAAAPIPSVKTDSANAPIITGANRIDEAEQKMRERNASMYKPNTKAK